MSRYNLEKKLQEQERQLHLQTSSRDNYLSQVNQLKQNCLSVSKQAAEATEYMERLHANGRIEREAWHAVIKKSVSRLVKQAKELHKKLEYVNEHQLCELKQCQGQLERSRRELLEVRVKINSDTESFHYEVGLENKCNSQELRMVRNLL